MGRCFDEDGLIGVVPNFERGVRLGLDEELAGHAGKRIRHAVHRPIGELLPSGGSWRSPGA
jgi:hypothetical protein